jgi:hypothetical protein
MIVDFEGDMTCMQCRKVFDFVPLSTAVQPGWPAGVTLVSAGDIPVTERAQSVFWTEDSWPTTCACCDPWGWVICAFPAGTSALRD